MRRATFTVAMCVLAAGWGAAQERRPEPPRPAAPPAPRLAQLEEDVEVLEAERGVKLAHVKAAEVGVKAAMLGAERLSKLAERGFGNVEELDRAKLAVEAARAQLEVHHAELKVMEVRVKHARKRLEEAKGGGERRPPAGENIRPVELPTGPDRKPPEPRPTNMLRSEPLRFDPLSADELKVLHAKAQAEVAARVERLKQAQAAARAAEDELAALTDPPKAGAQADEVDTANAKWLRAAKQLDEADRDYRRAQSRADSLRRWLEQAGKMAP